MNEIPFYVGKTNNCINRYTGHVHTNTFVMMHFINRCYYLYKTVPEMEILLKTHSNKSALRLEDYFVKLYCSKGYLLLNYGFNLKENLQDYRIVDLCTAKMFKYNFKTYYNQGCQRDLFDKERENIIKQINFLCKKSQ